MALISLIATILNLVFFICLLIANYRLPSLTSKLLQLKTDKAIENWMFICSFASLKAVVGYYLILFVLTAFAYVSFESGYTILGNIVCAVFVGVAAATLFEHVKNVNARRGTVMEKQLDENTNMSSEQRESFNFERTYLYDNDNSQVRRAIIKIIAPENTEIILMN